MSDLFSEEPPFTPQKKLIQFWSKLSFKPEHKQRVENIVRWEFNDYQKEKGIDLTGRMSIDVGFDHVSFYSRSYGDVKAVAKVAKTIVEQLKIEQPFFMSWSHTSDDLGNTSGGGAFCVRRGKETRWVDALGTIQKLVENENG